ncbi:MAG: hypothetical protein ACLSB9_19985 [Hydrogeniiclostridium mannosilyticum]
MVLQADNRVAAGFSGSDLLQNPVPGLGIIRAVTGESMAITV